MKNVVKTYEKRFSTFYFVLYVLLVNKKVLLFKNIFFIFKLKLPNQRYIIFVIDIGRYFSLSQN